MIFSSGRTGVSAASAAEDAMTKTNAAARNRPQAKAKHDRSESSISPSSLLALNPSRSLEVGDTSRVSPCIAHSPLNCSNRIRRTQPTYRTRLVRSTCRT